MDQIIKLILVSALLVSKHTWILSKSGMVQGQQMFSGLFRILYSFHAVMFYELNTLISCVTLQPHIVSWEHCSRYLLRESCSEKELKGLVGPILTVCLGAIQYLSTQWKPFSSPVCNLREKGYTVSLC